MYLIKNSLSNPKHNNTYVVKKIELAKTPILDSREVSGSNPS